MEPFEPIMGVEPTFAHPITIICLEGKLVYIGIRSPTQIRTGPLDLGNPNSILMNYGTICTPN